MTVSLSEIGWDVQTHMHTPLNFFMESLKTAVFLQYMYMRTYVYTSQELTDQKCLVDVMEKKLQGTIFSRAFLNPQGQLCLDFSRPIIFQKTLSHISDEDISYGISSPHRHDDIAISLLHCPCSIRLACDPSQACTSSVEESVVFCCHGSLDVAISLEEARLHLLAGAIANVLRWNGYSVSRDVLCKVGVVA